jgi:hypothetical protein
MDYNYEMVHRVCGLRIGAGNGRAKQNPIYHIHIYVDERLDKCYWCDISPPSHPDTNC